MTASRRFAISVQCFRSLNSGDKRGAAGAVGGSGLNHYLRKPPQKTRYVKPTLTPLGFIAELEMPGMPGACGQIWYS